MAKTTRLQPALLLALLAGCAMSPAIPTPLAPAELVERFVRLTQDPSRTMRYTVRLEHRQANVQRDGSGQLLASDWLVEAAGGNYRASTHTLIDPPFGDQAEVRSELAVVDGTGYQRDLLGAGRWETADFTAGTSALERLDPFRDLAPADLQYVGLTDNGEELHVIRLHDPFPVMLRFVGVDAPQLQRLDGNYTMEFYVTADGVPVGAYLLVAASLPGGPSVATVEARYAFADWGAPIVIRPPVP
jgi:hypothetical protein